MSATPSRDALRSSRVLIVATLVASYVLSQFYRVSNAVIAPELMSELSVSPEAMGALTGLFFLTFAAAQIPAGILLDRFGPRLTMSLMLLIAVAGAAIYAAADDATDLSLGRALIGIGCAPGLMGAFVVLGRWFPPERFATLASLVFIVGGLGQMIATTPLSLASDAFGWRGAFWGIAGITALASVMLLLVLRDTPPNHESETKTPETITDIARGLVAVFANRQLWHISALQFVCYASVLTVSGLWGGPYLKDVHGLDGTDRGNVLMAVNVAMIVGVIGYGRLERMVDSRKWTMVGGGLVTAAILATMALLPDPSLTQMALLLMALGCSGSYFMLAHAHARQVIPDALLGRGMTAQNVAVMAGVFVMQFVSGFIIGAFADPGTAAPAEAYRAVFASLALFTLVGLALYLPVSNMKPSQLAQAG